MDAVLESCCEGRPIVGREDELALLRHALDALRGGRGGLVVIEGAPGIGKTRLVREAATEARRQGLRVVWLAPGSDDSIIEAALNDATSGRPVVLIDDSHAIGEGRRPGLIAIADDLSSMPVLVLVTRTEPPGRIERYASDVQAERHATRLRLRPLRPGAMMSLAVRIGVATSIPVLERLYAATGGNTLLAVETLAAFGRRDFVDQGEPWPLSERAMLWTRAHLDELSPERRGAVEAASVLGEECDIGLVARLIEGVADPMQVRAALAESPFTISPAGRDLARFVPPLTRDLVYASLSADRRAALHMRAATALAAGGATSPALLAHRSLAAAAAGDTRRCEHYLLRLVQERASPPGPANPSGWPYFVREGEHWAIGFGDRAIRLTDRVGLLYLARLLSRPGVEFAALALGEQTRARNASATQKPAIVVERARVRVTRRIRDGIARIARANPELGAHLEQTIRTGTHCMYGVDPASAPCWEVRWSDPGYRFAADVEKGPLISTRTLPSGNASTPAKSVT
jgi:hypothetical protein